MEKNPMIRDIDLIVDLWNRLKDIVPKKDRLDAADIIVSVFDDYGFSDGVDCDDALDKELNAAIKSHYGFEQEEELDEWD